MSQLSAKLDLTHAHPSGIAQLFGNGSAPLHSLAKWSMIIWLSTRICVEGSMKQPRMICRSIEKSGNTCCAICVIAAKAEQAAAIASRCIMAGRSVLYVPCVPDQKRRFINVMRANELGGQLLDVAIRRARRASRCRWGPWPSGR